MDVKAMPNLPDIIEIGYSRKRLLVLLVGGIALTAGSADSGAAEDHGLDTTYAEEDGGEELEMTEEEAEQLRNDPSVKAAYLGASH